MPKLERRVFETSLQLEERADKPPVIRGHAAVFNKLSEDLFGFKERIKPGAFAKTLAQNPDVRALFNHDPNFILGRTKSGTLRLTEDANGLAYEIDPPDTQVARDLMTSLKRGDVDQSSFGFYVVSDNWKKENGIQIRELEEVSLQNGDVSPVTYPAYPATSVSVRSLWPEGVPEDVAQRADAKTKSVDGADHPMSDFAYHADPQDIETWHLPIFDAGHVQAALGRWNQTDMPDAAEKARAARRIIAACGKFNIELSDEMKQMMQGNSADREAELRSKLESVEGELKETKSRLAAAQQKIETMNQASDLATAKEVQRLERSKTALVAVIEQIENSRRGIVLSEDRATVWLASLNQISAIVGKEPESVSGSSEARKSVDAALVAARAELADISRRLVMANLPKN